MCGAGTQIDVRPLRDKFTRSLRSHGKHAKTYSTNFGFCEEGCPPKRVARDEGLRLVWLELDRGNLGHVDVCRQQVIIVVTSVKLERRQVNPPTIEYTWPLRPTIERKAWKIQQQSGEAARMVALGTCDGRKIQSKCWLKCQKQKKTRS